jgi:hypothetical protein
MQKSDPIVDEVRAARDAIAKESDYNIDKLAAAIKDREAHSGREVVRLPPRKVTVIVRRVSLNGDALFIQLPDKGSLTGSGR